MNTSGKSQKGKEPNQRRLVFTVPDVAVAAGISTPMVRKLIRQGLLPVVRIGRCVRVTRSAVMTLCGRE